MKKRQRKSRQRKRKSNRRGGLTAKQWKALRAKVIKAQGNRCAICGEPGHDGPSKKLKGRTIRRLYLDHDHKTGRVRGALCFKCNHRLLGRGLEDATLHRLAALYLELKHDWRRA
jgi:Autographiviridae endonuclease VII